ncbi:hypothetical protein K2173_003975 [Erythroxylum novogranatense]|uniref:Coiled-coil domain-containing protein 86 n=1 Tax=Erythroxylum novogranatense TaxID=1862640 RepID=A0AAV8SK14_9ROSI|nr:hypothetical protein K2173_003975 [Erythroxylum novogranatense]
MVIEDVVLSPPSKRSTVPSSNDLDKPAFEKPIYDGVIAGRVSGQKWKQGTSFEERERQKEIERAYRERMNELKEEIRRNKVEKRKMREEREKKKQENILRSGTKLQKIINPKTLKKIAKYRDRKLLKVIPDDVVSKKKKK